ncbi:AAA family ATPase [Streptomyces sp. HP-A2021]|uniref:ATP-binding protein n=1 Tax=Streptomyces sp. HP-A2021 TaxID=2927875 RepID=UPI001FAF04B0|nr:LuxR family transcriptional regulator [Streptomyces sp. HP-A2021]UOB08731.1 AAA family ATPase [Streptomyces sp. HP-A2021]
MTDLLERGAVLQDLADCLDQAELGHGQLVLLRGEAGIGKTAVVRRFAEEMGGAGRARVLLGACDPLSAPRPLGPLMDVATLLGPPVTQALEAGLRRRTDPGGIFNGVLTALGGQAGGQPTLLVIEDLNWADQATLDLVRFLARRIDRIPLLLLATYRDDEIGSTHPLAAVLGDLAALAAVHRCTLEPLSRRAVADLTAAAGHPVDAHELFSNTHGNPFYVTEVLAARAPGVPATVREAVLGRIARLPDRAREAAETVAVIGPRATEPLIAAVSREAATGLEDCLASGVLRPDGPVLCFRNELARRAVWESLPVYRRARLHGRVLAALRSGPVDPVDLAQLAFHAEQAGDEGAVAEYAPRAASYAAALGSHREAAELYGRAVRNPASAPSAQRVELLEAQAYENYVTGNVPEAIDAWDEAVLLRHEQGDRRREAEDLRRLSHMHWLAVHRTDAWRAGLDAVRVLEGEDAPRELAWAYAHLAQLACLGYDPATTADYAGKATELGLGLGEPALKAHARVCEALVNVACRGQGWPSFEDAWHAAMAEEGLTDDACKVGAVACWTAALHHDLPRLDRLTVRTCAYCREHELPMFLVLALGTAGLGMLHRGQWARAAQKAGDVLDRNPQPVHRLLPLVTSALVRARRGEPGVWPLLDEALSYGEDADLFLAGPVWAARAEAAWLEGDDSLAVAEAEHGLKAVTIDSDPWLVGGLLRWSRLTGGEPPQTRAAEPYALELAGQWREAVRVWEELGCPYDAALARLGGDVPAIRQALETFRSLGARPAAERAWERLRAAGVRRTSYGKRASTCANPYGLTKREREVQHLLREGLSNREIAARLYITPKTAAHHVAAVLAKLGVHTREEAAIPLDQDRSGLS